MPLETGRIFRHNWTLRQSRFTEFQNAESPQIAGFRVILQQDYRVSVSTADCMAVDAVPIGIVSLIFPKP